MLIQFNCVKQYIYITNIKIPFTKESINKPNIQIGSLNHSTSVPLVRLNNAPIQQWINYNHSTLNTKDHTKPTISPRFFFFLYFALSMGFSNRIFAVVSRSTISYPITRLGVGIWSTTQEKKTWNKTAVRKKRILSFHFMQNAASHFPKRSDSIELSDIFRR